MPLNPTSLWTLFFQFNSEIGNMIRLQSSAPLLYRTTTQCLITLFLLQLLGCIHLNLSAPSPLKANDLEFKEPKKPFILFKDTEFDKSWQSNTTGNVIALFTDCTANSDRPLTKSILELAKGFDRIESTKQSTIFFNGRESIQGEFKGHIDGIKVSMEGIVFNKNKCFYQLTYSGVSNQFEKDRVVFEEFKKDFRAP